MVRKIYSVFSFCLVLNGLAAQDLHVYYNVFRDSVYYVQNGKSTTNPLVKKGGNVLLHVENYNNYLYDVSVEVEKEEIEVASTNPAGMLGQLGGAGASPLNFLFKGGDQMMGAFKFMNPLEGPDLNLDNGFSKSEADKLKEEKVRQLLKLEAEFTNTKKQFFALDTELKALQDQIQQKMAAQRIQAFAIEEVNSIRLNPHLEPSQIKRMSAEYMERIFAEKDPNKIDLNQVLKIADAQTELPKAIDEYSNKVTSYASSTEKCDSLLTQFNAYDFPESTLPEFKSSAEAFVVLAKAKSVQLKDNAAKLTAKIPEIQSLDPKSISALRTTYIELNSNSFSKTYRHTATGEKLRMKLKLSPIDSLQRLGIKTLEMTPVEVSVFGGMRVRASVGLNFGRFIQKPQEYFVRDSFLQSGNIDAFIPVMTSFVHFYAPSRKAVSVAGSFGVGFPLGGGENLQSISFFLGPSLLFGKSERIVLNAGIMGGKVERLSQGYKIGDAYFSDGNIAPTNSVYELGYYLGVSFNLSGAGN